MWDCGTEPMFIRVFLHFTSGTAGVAVPDEMCVSGPVLLGSSRSPTCDGRSRALASWKAARRYPRTFVPSTVYWPTWMTSGSTPHRRPGRQLFVKGSGLMMSVPVPPAVAGLIVRATTELDRDGAVRDGIGQRADAGDRLRAGLMKPSPAMSGYHGPMVSC